MSEQRRTFSKEDKLKILKEVKEHGVKITLDKHGLYPARTTRGSGSTKR